jgi:hypothetical protein
MEWPKILKVSSQEHMAHICNPSYLRGWDLEDRGLRSTQANSLRDLPISKITRTKWNGGVDQVECLLCKHKTVSSNPSPSKKKKIKNMYIWASRFYILKISWMTKTGKFSVIYCNTYLIYYTSMKLFKVFFFFFCSITVELRSSCILGKGSPPNSAPTCSYFFVNTWQTLFSLSEKTYIILLARK